MSEKRCQDCNGELSCCGEMTSDGPAMDCRACILAAEIERLRVVEKRHDSLSRNHWTCLKCGGSWNCERADVPKENGNSKPTIPCPFCTIAQLRADAATLAEAVKLRDDVTRASCVVVANLKPAESSEALKNALVLVDQACAAVVNHDCSGALARCRKEPK